MKHVIVKIWDLSKHSHVTDLPRKLLLQTFSRALILLYRFLTFPHVKDEYGSTHHRPTPPQVTPHHAAWGSEALSCAPRPAWCHARRSGSQSSVQTDTHTDSLPSHPWSLISYSKPKTCWEKTQTPNTPPGHNLSFVLNPTLNFTRSVKDKHARQFN